MSPAQPRAGTKVELGLALLRVGLLPVILVTEGTNPYPEAGALGFGVMAVAATVWAIALLAVRLAEQQRLVELPWLRRVEPVVDLLLLTGLTYASGGPFSQVRKAFFVVPFAAAMRMPPAPTAAWGVVAIVAYVLASVAHPTGAFGDEALPALSSHVLYLLWAGAFATFVSAVLERRRRVFEELAESRGRLATQALAAEQRERERLAQLLHDEAVQNLLVARQELTAVRRHGRADALDRLEEALELTVRQLRGEIFELHPYVLDHAGLAAAVRALAERAKERSGAAVEVDVDPAAEGRRDALVTWLVRELLTNAAKHARADRIGVEVRCTGDGLRVAVDDDGRGFSAAEAERALLEGHIGLAAARQRVEALGGALHVRTSPGAGATIAATLPL